MTHLFLPAIPLLDCGLAFGTVLDAEVSSSSDSCAHEAKELGHVEAKVSAPLEVIRLNPSIRSISFREGLIDHALSTTLAERDSVTAKNLAAKIAPSMTQLERDSVKYRQARTTIFEALDKP